MSTPAATYYKKGQWRACCDFCGKTFKADQLGLQWNGFRTCFETCFELRNAQELIKAPQPQRPVPWTRNCEANCECSSCRASTRVLDSKSADRISLG